MSLSPWQRLSKTGLLASLVSDVLYTVGSGQYLVCVPYGADLIPLENDRSVSGLLWAYTDGAAARSLLRQVEADPLTNGMPPGEVLLEPGENTYSSVLRAARLGSFGEVVEAATYRLSDGRFVDRTIALPGRTFHYRDRDGGDDEPCYALEYRFPRPR